MSTCRATVRKYWKSRQINNRQDMEDTVANGFALHMFGEKTPLTKGSLLVGSYEDRTPWNDVEMISEIYTDRSAAIYYRGISTATNQPVFVSEHLELDDDLRIKTAHVMIVPPPGP